MNMQMQGNIPITEEHLKVMADKLFNAMVGLHTIIEECGDDKMRQLRDEVLQKLGIQLHPVQGPCTCPKCQQEHAVQETTGKNVKYDA